MAQNLQSAVEVWFASIGTAPDYNTMHYWAGTGQSEFDINFSGGYISREHVKAFIRNDTTGISTPVAVTFLTASRVSVSAPVPVGYTICIYRDTPKNAPLALFIDGAIMNAVNFDRNAKQSVFAVAELLDRFDATNSMAEEAILRASEAKTAAAQAASDAASAQSNAAIAQSAATSAEASAQSAATLAGTANTNASNALSVANGIDAKATQALANSTQAVATAQDAEAVANAIDGKATTALSQSSAAVATANTALTTANAIEGKADRALQAAKPVLAVEWVPLRAAMWNGHVASDGQVLNRADYPDAWAAIAAGAVPVVSDADWLADPLKRGSYTTGNGSTTFRVPDYNGKYAGTIGALFQRGDGLNSAAAGGLLQRDAIRNIVGQLGGTGGSAGRSYALGFVKSLLNGVFVSTAPNSHDVGAISATQQVDSTLTDTVAFDASRVVPTAADNRPASVTGCWAVRLFGVVQNPGQIDAATLATQVAGVQSRVSILEQRKSTCLVNATGTGAPHETVSSALPANIVNNQRYVLPNPFGVNTPVMCFAEILVGGKWAATGWVYASEGGYGASAVFVQGEGIVIQTGKNALQANRATEGGGGHVGGLGLIYNAPCRVFVRLLEA